MQLTRNPTFFGTGALPLRCSHAREEIHIPRRSILAWHDLNRVRAQVSLAEMLGTARELRTGGTHQARRKPQLAM
jgi:hypothetical protein